MEGEPQKPKEGFMSNFSILLELSASDDLIGFKRALEEEGFDIDEASCWYGRSIGSKKMGMDERTPLMIASMFGSADVVKFILSTGLVDVNRACGSDGATALHCAAFGGSLASPEIVKLLIDAAADVNSVDVNGKRPGDVISMAQIQKPSFNSKRKSLEMMLKGKSDISDDSADEITLNQTPKHPEYPIDLSLPDIKNGIYGTDEFRMYTFKVKPCSRAYSHDWTECPFVHPGENARRRDPRKYHYSCVPCPEFRKGTCRQGDACEYAHGVFECWLHPAQYRTRLCKDETGCTRRVCFFAHKPEELRPLYASTGSAVPSPRSGSNGLDLSGLNLNLNLNPLALGSPSGLMIPTSTPPMSPAGAGAGASLSPVWQNPSTLMAPPTLQLPGSRLKSAICARDMELDMELLGMDGHHQQQLIDELTSAAAQSGWSSSPLATAAALAASSAAAASRSAEYSRMGVGVGVGGVKPTNLDDVFASLDPSLLSQLQGLSMKNSSVSAQAQAQLHSPTGMQIRQNMNQQMRSSYPTAMASSPVRAPSTFGLDPATAAAVMSSRSAAFAKRSQSFIDRGGVNRHMGSLGGGGGMPSNSVSNMSSGLSDWSSPDGKLDWGIQGEELNKLRKSASFGIRNNNNGLNTNMKASSPAMGMGGGSGILDEPDVSWVQSLVKDAPSQVGPGRLTFDEHQQQQLQLQQQYHLMEQLYMEQEQMVA
ncbi:hypothetical protein Syun_000257 [Stephania yunnanensis]|uniref:C3H1-type domain-containing protein n=1 Tax=Stephania yunnanensis TaxID=152371 RepID=A0AAP0LBL3_9MAGN